MWDLLRHSLGHHELRHLVRQAAERRGAVGLVQLVRERAGLAPRCAEVDARRARTLIALGALRGGVFNTFPRREVGEQPVHEPRRERLGVTLAVELK